MPMMGPITISAFERPNSLTGDTSVMKIFDRAALTHMTQSITSDVNETPMKVIPEVEPADVK